MFTLRRTHTLRQYSQKAVPKVSATHTNLAIANKQLLYTTDPVTPGSIFFLPHGTRVFNKLVQFMKNQQTKYGFQEVITPLIYKKQLYETSGHWDNYKDDMFKVVGNENRDEDVHFEHGVEHNVEHNVEHGVAHDHEGDAHGHGDDAHVYGLKPMNCPGHCIIYSKFERSYNELPIRYSDFSALHRNEASGALSGLTRVRRFHQDDGHIFCELSQINSEIKNTLMLIKNTYKVFGIDEDGIQFFLSTRPLDKFIGDVETWDAAETQLKQVLDEVSTSWQVRPEDGAFYGPKIDVLLTDNYGKSHQVGTVQLDFQLPARFQLKYVDEAGNRDKQPIMVHRAVFGSLERFFAILLDHYQGKWPFWLNPRQAVVIPVAERHADFAREVRDHLTGDILGADSISPMTGYNFYVDVDERSETVGNRIKDALKKGYSYIVMVGDKDIQNGTISVRTRDDRRVENISTKDLYHRFIQQERDYK